MKKKMATTLLLLGLALAIAGTISLFEFPFLWSMVIFTTSIVLCFGASIMLKATTTILISLASVGLTVLSFAYQPLGPEYQMTGTECQRISECFSPVRGGGFPIQYVIDTPGITFWDDLGYEDEIRLLSFIVDFCFYNCMLSFLRWVFQRMVVKYTRLETSA